MQFDLIKVIDSRLKKPNGNGVFVESDGSTKRIKVVYGNGCLSDFLLVWRESDGTPFFIGDVKHAATTQKAIYRLIRKHFKPGYNA